MSVSLPVQMIPEASMTRCRCRGECPGDPSVPNRTGVSGVWLCGAILGLQSGFRRSNQSAPVHGFLPAILSGGDPLPAPTPIGMPPTVHNNGQRTEHRASSTCTRPRAFTSRACDRIAVSYPFSAAHTSRHGQPMSLRKPAHLRFWPFCAIIATAASAPAVRRPFFATTSGLRSVQGRAST